MEEYNLVPPPRPAGSHSPMPVGAIRYRSSSLPNHLAPSSATCIQIAKASGRRAQFEKQHQRLLKIVAHQSYLIKDVTAFHEQMVDADGTTVSFGEHILSRSKLQICECFKAFELDAKRLEEDLGVALASSNDR